MALNRCGWVSSEQLYVDYHDNEWGKACHDDAKLFELLLLEGFQAGLSWITILRKREHYRQALDNFDVQACASYSEQKINELLQNPLLVRNRLKMWAIVANAKAFIAVQQEFGSFAKYAWGFVNHQPIVNRWASYREAPTTTAQSDALSKDLKKRGFKFVGSTICQSFLQASGMIDDHEADCICSI